MSTLYSCVHHEMLGPLKSNEEAAKCLLAGLRDSNLIHLARVSLLCTKQVLLHANDLLDQKLLQNGRFTPAFSQDSVRRVIEEIVHIVSMTVSNRNIELSVDMKQVENNYPILSFDTRRL